MEPRRHIVNRVAVNLTAIAIIVFVLAMTVCACLLAISHYQLSTMRDTPLPVPKDLPGK